MAEYISRSELQSEITKGVGECRIKAFDPSVNCILQIIHRLAAEDVQPINHGKWIAENRDNRGYADCYTCTNCNCYTYTYVLMKDCDYDYCPKCGAIMDLKDGETNG